MAPVLTTQPCSV